MTVPPDHADDPEDIRDDEPWTEEDEQRYQQRRALELKLVRRRRRQTFVFLLLVLVVLGAGGTAAGVYQGWWEWPPWEGESTPAATSTGAPCPTTAMTAAAPVEAVTLAVLNSTSRPGLASGTAEAFQARGFAVEQVGNDPAGVLEGTAVVRHGPEGAASARTVAAYVDDAEIVDDGRAGTAVEISLGLAFSGLRSAEEVAAVLTPAPATAPPGCVVQEPTPEPTATETAPATEPAPEATG